MAIPLNVNGAVFEYPENFNENWGVNATGWAQAVTNGMLQRSGGNFPLTAQVDFGTSFGIKVKSLTSETVNPATAGYVRLAKTDVIEWRNNANSADIPLGINASDQLTFNGIAIAATVLAQNDIFVGDASNSPVGVPMSGDATIVSSGALTIANNAITNSKLAANAVTDVKVAAGAAIAVNKLAALTINRAVATDGSGFLTPSTTTSTELGFVSGVTSSIQTQLNAKASTALDNLSGTAVNSDINMNSHKLTNLTNGSAASDSAAFGQIPVFTDWALYTPTIQGLNISSKTFYWMQMGNHIFVKGVLTNSTATGTNLSISLPNGTLINSGKAAQNFMMGTGERIPTAGNATHSAAQIINIFYDGSNTDVVFLTIQSGSNVFTKNPGTTIFANGDTCAVYFDYPI